jgi:hypothetical protein
MQLVQVEAQVFAHEDMLLTEDEECFTYQPGPLHDFYQQYQQPGMEQVHGCPSDHTSLALTAMSQLFMPAQPATLETEIDLYIEPAHASQYRVGKSNM